MNEMMIASRTKKNNKALIASLEAADGSSRGFTTAMPVDEQVGRSVLHIQRERERERERERAHDTHQVACMSTRQLWRATWRPRWNPSTLNPKP